jgi:mannose-1-phosphate guanylyltransferase
VQHAVIMAGGPGTRLWPLSRIARPKPFMRIFRGQSLLRQSYERLAARFAPEQIHVITMAAYVPMVAGELPELPAENLMGEPCGRDTANAIGMAAALLERRDPQAIMGVFTADHIIRPVDRFSAALGKAYAHVSEHPEALVTFGIRPTRPHTGYGYIHRGQAIGEGLHRVIAFKEKPDAATAAGYVGDGQHYWNSGMFVWRTDTYLNELARVLPESCAKLRQMAEAWSKPRGRQEIETIYPTLTRISVDFAVMEKAGNVAVVEMDCQWLDVGSWTSLTEVFEADASGNILAADQGALLNSEGNIVVAEDDHLIALVGAKDLIVVRSGDATLICHRDSAQQIKDLIQLVQDRHGKRYL